jgi:hypothetical protein
VPVVQLFSGPAVKNKPDTFSQLYVCDKGKSQRVGYPGAVATKLAKGATLGMCEADLPLQYK